MIRYINYNIPIKRTVVFLRKLTFTLSTINAVLNLMVIGIFMPGLVITLYGSNGGALLHGSKWFYAIYALIPVLISGIFLIVQPKKSGEDSDQSAIDEFLSGKSRKSDNIDMLCTWFFAVISWVMTGLALNDIENIGVILPSIIVVMLSAFIIFTSSLSGSGEKAQICGVDVKWLTGKTEAIKRTKRLSMLLGVMSGMVGVCLAAWSLVINNNIPNCIAVLELLVIAFMIPLLYSRKAGKNSENN